ncbi:MAG: 3-oxoacyl-ACP reductase FabG [Actinomycetota bacterium]|jgi:2-hydroxycyclohexanecarboxyl-CoA dehydrogenase|nr:3-oxoacyl-ACP reductase FabG [Actinomycetota bacterium]
MRGLSGKVAFVTGAGRGMGQAIAARLVEEGARVAVTDVDGSTAAATAAVLGDGAVGLRVDITDTGSVGAGVLEAEHALGPIDVLINNAGWDRIAPFLDTDEDLWDRLIDINLKGPLRCAHAVLPGMVARQAGRVINISSDAARVGSTGESVYSAAKAGIIGFTKTLAREVARHNITANVICPGPTDTPLLGEIMGEGNDRLIDSLKRGIPMKRLGRPDDIAGAVAFLASDDAGFITGQTLSVSGGLTMA